MFSLAYVTTDENNITANWIKLNNQWIYYKRTLCYYTSQLKSFHCVCNWRVLSSFIRHRLLPYIIIQSTNSIHQQATRSAPRIRSCIDGTNSYAVASFYAIIIDHQLSTTNQYPPLCLLYITSGESPWRHKDSSQSARLLKLQRTP